MVSKFKLLMTTDVKSEVWDYSLTLSNALLRNIDAEILMISFGGEPTSSQREQCENLNIEFKFTDFSHNFYSNVETNPDIPEIKRFFDNTVKEFNPHVVHFNHAYPNLDINKPCVFTCHNDLVNNKIWNCKTNRYNSLDNNLSDYREFINTSLNKADVVIAQSRFIAECLVKTYDVKRGIKIIYSGIDHAPFAGIPLSPTIVINGNLLDNGKNINLLSNIAYKLPDNIRIKILGDVRIDRKLPRNVEFHRNIESNELQEIYKNSSIYLALSDCEMNGLSSIQAAYSGCAILANDLPVFKELWGDCAYIFEKDNVNSLMKCINNLVENKNFLEVISRNCQAKALSVFNSKRMAFEYINLYKFILKKYQTVEKISQENSKAICQNSEV